MKTLDFSNAIYREETSPLVTGVSRAICTRCASKEEALLAYRSAWEQGYVVRRPV